jgi:hypothetical protein
LRYGARRVKIYHVGKEYAALLVLIILVETYKVVAVEFLLQVIALVHEMAKKLAEVLKEKPSNFNNFLLIDLPIFS